MSDFKPTVHPVLTLPTPEQAAAMGAEAWMTAVLKREEVIRRELASPLWGCWEPPIWKVCDALLGLPWLPEAEAEAIRRNLGFSQPVNVLYLLGAQRSSKTEYAANRMSRLMQAEPGGLFWIFHNTMTASIDSHQKLFWKYLPAHLRGKAILSQTTYIAYKDKTGFSDGSMVLSNLSKARYLSYDMDLTDLQGLNVNAAWGDEFIGPELVETLKARVSVKNGPVLVTLAPIQGYTPLVQSACDGAETVRECTAFMSPSDGGPRDVAGYLGLSDDEAAQLKAWLGRKMKPPVPNVPWSRPEDCAKWLTGEPSQRPPGAGRTFKKVPRVQRPADPEGKSAIVHFHGGDNPFGNPYNLALLHAAAGEEYGNRIFYGLAREGMTRKFPKFSKPVHVVPPTAIPAEGTNYLFIDPCGGRNFFMSWIRVTTKAAYLYREWPGNYEIPEIGVPGPWALTDGKKGDGRMGPAQESFGFGLVRYKMEIARLEGWKDAEKPRPPEKTDKEHVLTWWPENGAKEIITRRFLDSRFASSPHMEHDRPVTLLENFMELGLHFEPTPGDDVEEGVPFINDALDYDQGRPIDALNCPRLFISAACENTIFALRIWRNAERGKGATKDPIDNLRYFVMSDVSHVRPESYASEGGGHY